MQSQSLLFVCMGNICRSPSAHGVMRQLVQQAGLAPRIAVDSAATHNYHPGEPPDARSQRHAQQRGYQLADLRARQIRQADFEHHDLILVMDWNNLEHVQALCPPEHAHKLRRLTEFCTRHDSDVVPDPYYGGADGFERVLDLVEDACTGLLAHVSGRPSPAP
ncbi:low molecular weight phosphotyrosine protein phosphatase [Curvibacter sp. CHRR-16]|uniref:low molecular weight protein-tyrosine-phosphatase n=1 Tax=Curvibacter sp. CHRR-16 TaxID=2835872 RepID=UPI001BDAEC8B|nr:low molecular weight protein-tyrosine-phosphatase [Curvibacter sp. CHRR-16]MBT0569749.1 low molecular weight phosphotyrosine protein phosphatase [Curvibacter sp. CHRR-16]